MKKEDINHILQLTQECLNRYWKLDMDYMLGFYGEDSVWIGSEESQFLQGYDDVKKEFYDIKKELKPCHLLNQEFIVQTIGQKTCIIVGRYLVTTDENVEYFLQVQQRCMFAWEIEKDKFKIRSVHISNPLGELKVRSGEKFVNTIGKMAKKYLDLRVESLNDTSRIIVTDFKGILRFITVYEIEYVIAEGRYTTIVTIDNDRIFARISISELVEQSKGRLLLIHRSYVVNPLHVLSIKRYELEMRSKITLSVPQKKYLEVRNELNQYFVK